MISRYTERNEFGGYTWQIKNSSTIRVHIKGTERPCEYIIEIQEFGWVKWSSVESKVSDKSLPNTIREAFDLLHVFLDDHDDFDVTRRLLDKEMGIVLDGLKKSDYYIENMEPLE